MIRNWENCKKIEAFPCVKKNRLSMQSICLKLPMLSTSCFFNRPTVPLVNISRSYVKAFWEENNNYKGLRGHVIPPPKRGGYTLNSRRKVIWNDSLHHYFNLQVCPSLRCTYGVCHTLYFFNFLSSTCLIKLLLQLGCLGKAGIPNIT